MLNKSQIAHDVFNIIKVVCKIMSLLLMMMMSSFANDFKLNK